jgi:mRNA interferase RelE/StbE
MRHEIVLAPEAVEDFKRLDAHRRALVRAAIEKHLRREPVKLGRSRIKRLRGIRRPGYRLRVEEVRVLYDVTGPVVQILAIVPQTQASDWLAESAEAE